jgi:hypothetical protein
MARGQMDGWRKQHGNDWDQEIESLAKIFNEASTPHRKGKRGKNP